MNLNDYQSKSQVYAKYLTNMYPFLGLAEEAGEVLGKLAKKSRKQVFADPYYDLTEDEQEAVAKELGDVLWMLAACCDRIGYTLGEVARMNLDKLASREKRGVIVGEGDDR